MNQGVLLVGSNFLNQSIIWGHGAIDETGAHEGSLSSSIIHMNFTYGLTDYWNVEMSFIGGSRKMEFDGDSNIHHRNETRSGIGDTRILLRRIIENTDFGPGNRIFGGLGLIIPSGNVLKENPFELGQKGESHTHFSMSEGNLKGIGELQYFYRSTFPVLFGSVYHIEYPLKENPYGFLSGTKNTLDLFAYWQTKSILGSIPFFTISMVNQRPDLWDGKKAPNSGGIIIQPGFGLNWHKDDYLFTVGLHTPGKYTVDIVAEDLGDVDSHVKPWTISLNFRKVFTHE